MNGAIIRIVLRYGLGALVAWGVIETNLALQLQQDPDVFNLLQICVGFVGSMLVEGFYMLAKKLGWAT